ncbi:MAG: DUF5058 family protein [Clostridiales bacterium]|nr:DUF5058 family protein [Clostridiales bacterium]
MDFKESGFMYAVALVAVAFVLAQSIFFIVKSWKHAKEIGIEKSKLKNTVMSSILFSIAPAISILATVIVLAGALGIVLPWTRLTVIGNLAYETTAAQSAVEAMGGSLSVEITDEQQFTTVAWAMTIGSIAPLILLPFVCKKLQKKIGSAVNKSENAKKLGDIISAAAFIGIISAFIARAIAGTTEDGTGNAGFMSIAVLIVSIVAMLILETLCKKFKLSKLEPFAMPLSMFIGMGSAILFESFLPDYIVNFVWR